MRATSSQSMRACGKPHRPVVTRAWCLRLSPSQVGSALFKRLWLHSYHQRPAYSMKTRGWLPATLVTKVPGRGGAVGARSILTRTVARVEPFRCGRAEHPHPSRALPQVMMTCLPTHSCGAAAAVKVSSGEADNVASRDRPTDQEWVTGMHPVSQQDAGTLRRNIGFRAVQAKLRAWSAEGIGRVPQGGKPVAHSLIAG